MVRKAVNVFYLFFLWPAGKLKPYEDTFSQHRTRHSLAILLYPQYHVGGQGCTSEGDKFKPLLFFVYLDTRRSAYLPDHLFLGFPELRPSFQMAVKNQTQFGIN